MVDCTKSFPHGDRCDRCTELHYVANSSYCRVREDIKNGKAVLRCPYCGTFRRVTQDPSMDVRCRECWATSHYKDMLVRPEQKEGHETWIISRHAGAIEWIRERGFDGMVVEHFDGTAVAGDTYVGTLPLNAIAQILQDGGEFILLVLPDVPMDQRGMELTLEMMTLFGAKLLRINSIEMEAV